MSNDLNSGFSAAELALLAAAFTTIADGLVTLSTALAIQEAQQIELQKQQSASTPSSQQRQIDQIQRDVRAIKQMLSAKGAKK